MSQKATNVKFFKAENRKLIVIPCLLVMTICVVLMFSPQARDAIISFVENEIAHRSFENPKKWAHLILSFSIKVGILSLCISFFSSLNPHIYRKIFNLAYQHRKTYTIITFLLFTIIVYYGLHNAPTGFNDDVVHREMGSKYTVKEVFIQSHNTWSSRFLILAAQCWFCGINPIVWALTTTAIIILFVYSTGELIFKSNFKHHLWSLALILFPVFPHSSMDTCGWITATILYLWPASLGVFALLALKYYSEDKPIRAFLYPIFLLSAAFSTNQELVAALMFGYLSLFITRELIVNRKIPVFVLILFFVCCSNILHALTCPGNELRSISEAEGRFPEYLGLHSSDKLTIGFLDTMAYYMTGSLSPQAFGPEFNIILPFLLLGLLAGLIAAENTRKQAYTVWAFILLSYASLFCLKMGNKLSFLYNTLPIEVANLPIHQFALGLLFLAANFLGLLYLIFSVFRNFHVASFALLIFVAGFCSRVVVGFSPTIYASGARTFIYCTLSILVVIALIFQEIHQNRVFQNTKPRGN